MIEFLFCYLVRHKCKTNSSSQERNGQSGDEPPFSPEGGIGFSKQEKKNIYKHCVASLNDINNIINYMLFTSH